MTILQCEFKVKTDRNHTHTVRCEKRKDGWYIIPPKKTEFIEFALPSANKRDIQQLVSKEYDYRY
jgi:hypothetical protein